MSTIQTAKQQAVREAWLLFFNQTLRQQGLLSEEDYRRMGVLIRKASPDAAKGKNNTGCIR